MDEEERLMSRTLDAAEHRLKVLSVGLMRQIHRTTSYEITERMGEEFALAVNTLIDAKIEESKEKKDE